MNVEFVLAKSKPLNKKELITIKTTSEKIVFCFYNKDTYNLALKSKDFIFSLYAFVESQKDIKHLIKIRSMSLNYGRLFDNFLLEYFSKIPYSEKQEIIASLRRLSRKYSGLELANKLSLFLLNLKNLSKKYNLERQYISPIETLKTLERGRLLREKFILTTTQACKETYLGFIRAIKSNTLTTAKIIINGKEQRVFIKSPVGVSKDYAIKTSEITHLKEDTRSLLNGFNQLAMDPKTFKLYEITTIDGKLHGTPTLPLNDLMPKEKRLVKELLEKQLKEHLNNLYAKRNKEGKVIVPGIKRMKETHKRFKAKHK
jgi:hypothetical protein